MNICHYEDLVRVQFSYFHFPKCCTCRHQSWSSCLQWWSDLLHVECHKMHCKEFLENKITYSNDIFLQEILWKLNKFGITNSGICSAGTHGETNCSFLSWGAERRMPILKTFHFFCCAPTWSGSLYGPSSAGRDIIDIFYWGDSRLTNSLHCVSTWMTITTNDKDVIVICINYRALPVNLKRNVVHEPLHVFSKSLTSLLSSLINAPTYRSAKLDMASPSQGQVGCETMFVWCP